MKLESEPDDSPQPVRLRGITWNHTRGYVPMVATAQRYSEQHPHVTVSWEKRSLQEFADQPLAQLGEAYDLLVIDHPWSGFAAASGVLEPLDDWLPETFLSDQAAHSVGASYRSYHYDEHQWALPIDAATPVSVSRPDLLEREELKAPQTWEEVIAVGRRGLLGCSAIPLDVYGNFLNLCKSNGAEIFPNRYVVVAQSAGVCALEQLREMMSYVPDRYFAMNPIAALEEMARENKIAYNPYVYGYGNYSRAGYAPHRLAFGDVPSTRTGLPGCTMLGGTGLAVSARSAHKQIAADYAGFVAAPATQRGIYFWSGGQPGHRQAWHDPEANALTTNFFTHTLPALDRAFVRPRAAWYIPFQDEAGFPIHNYLRQGGDAHVVWESLNRLYRHHRNATPTAPTTPAHESTLASDPIG